MGSNPTEAQTNSDPNLIIFAVAHGLIICLRANEQKDCKRDCGRLQPKSKRTRLSGPIVIQDVLYRFFSIPNFSKLLPNMQVTVPLLNVLTLKNRMPK